MQDTQTYKKLKDKLKDNFPQFLVIHHSGGTKLDPLADTSHHTAVIMEKGHISFPNFFEGLGYHYVIHKDGEIWRGRPEDYHGAHTKEQDMNTKSIAICLAGNFDATLPTKEQENALAGLVASIRGRYMITMENIVPHRHFLGNPPYKSCYGKLLSDTWARDLVLQDVSHETSKEEIKKQITDLL